MGLGLYIHIPFCNRRCVYCDFYLLELKDNFQHPQSKETVYQDFLNSLQKEIQLYQKELKQREFQSLYMGGGTPSLLNREKFSFLCDLLFSNFHFSKDFEFCIESNPESIDSEKLSGYREWGVNRISLGCQSFHDSLLKQLGRESSKDEILQKYKLIRSMNFENINLDLIFGLLPMEEYQKDLKISVSLEPNHISCYGLSLERKSFQRKVQNKDFLVCTDEESLKQYQFSHRFLEANHYFFYEVSNFAQKGWECQHNWLYWDQKDYLGLGPSACGTLSGVRYKNFPSLKRYKQYLYHHQKPYAQKEILTPLIQKTEAIFLGLRTRKGIDVSILSSFVTDTPENTETHEKWKKLQQLIQKGFLKKLKAEKKHKEAKEDKNDKETNRTKERIVATKKGLAILDNITAQLL